MNYIYGWKLEYFKGKIFNGTVPKKQRNMRTYDLLNYYFEEDPISVFKTIDGHILGIFVDKVDLYMHSLSAALVERVRMSIRQVMSSEFDTFLLLKDPQLMEASV